MRGWFEEGKGGEMGHGEDGRRWWEDFGCSEWRRGMSF